MRCPDCNKFVGNEEVDPEVEVDLSADNQMVNVQVRIANACDQCGTELREATFEFDEDVEAALNEHKCPSADFTAEETNSERTSRSGYFSKKTGEFISKGGRYAKTFYGASVDVEIKCNECGETVHTFTVSEDTQASCMDEC